jgi:hypothetical protein
MGLLINHEGERGGEGEGERERGKFILFKAASQM